jgi:predicted dehydrogenase
MSTIPRRDFLAASAAAILASPSVLAAAGRPTRFALSQLNLGFIGVGKRTFELMPAFLARADVRVIAVCDVDTIRREHGRSIVDRHYARSPSGTNSGCAAFADHRELLALPGLDAVVIATPDHWHAHQIIDACRAGKDIHCEKPLTLTIAEAGLAIEAVRRHNRVFQTGSQQRSEYEGRFRTACEYIRAGRLGTLLYAHVGVGTSSIPCDLPEEPAEPGLDWDRWLGPAPLRPYNSILAPRGIHNHYPQWRLYREYSGGLLTDMGAHHFDIVQWALRADRAGPVRILPPADPGASYGARLFYPSGVEVTHGGPSGATFIGTAGIISVDRNRLNSIPTKILDEPLADADERLPRPKDHIDDWLQSISSRKPPICDVEIGARSVTVCHLLNLAYWHRRELRWDPAAWEFPGDPEANGWRDHPRRGGYALPPIE